MKIVLVLSVVFLDYVLITNAGNSKTGIKQLSDQVGSYVCKKIECLVQGRPFKKRFKEHLPTTKGKPKKSRYAEHLIDNCHNYSNIDNNMEILHTCSKGRYMSALEKFEIYKAFKQEPKNILNEQLSYSSNTLYDSVIKMQIKEPATQDEGLIPSNLVVHKRHATHIKRNKNRTHKTSAQFQILQSKKNAKLITQNLRNQVNKMKRKTIKLQNSRKKKLFTRRIKISTLSKITGEKTITQLKPDTVKNITVSTAQDTLTLVKNTADGLQQSLIYSAKNIHEMAKFCIGELQKFSYGSNLKVQNAIKSGDVEGAKDILTVDKKTSKMIATAMVNSLDELYTSAKKGVKDLSNTGSGLVVESTESHVHQIEDLKSNKRGVKKFVSSATKEIQSFSNDTANIFKAMARDGLRKVELMLNDALKSIKNIPEQNYKLDVTNVNEDKGKGEMTTAMYTKSNETDEDLRRDQLYNDMVVDIHKKTSLLYSKGSSYISSLNSLSII